MNWLKNTFCLTFSTIEGLCICACTCWAVYLPKVLEGHFRLNGMKIHGMAEKTCKTMKIEPC